MSGRLLTSARWRYRIPIELRPELRRLPTLTAWAITWRVRWWRLKRAFSGEPWSWLVELALALLAAALIAGYFLGGNR